MNNNEMKVLEENNLALTQEIFVRFGAHDIDGIASR